ncbi:MAG: DUF1828 domain-containing protein [Proteobacteria bacterium]|nr:DUF1828 domain-containing protein [Pseudomonadota bacterium]
MNVDTIERDFREKVSEKLKLESEGINRYRVFTPFLFEDGDHLSVILKKEDGYWVLTDEGHTYMHLTYDLDEKALQQGTRQKIISNTLSMFSVQDRGGEILIPIQNEQYGNALYSYIQALLKITDISYLSRERVRSTFMEDFRAFMEETVPANRRDFDWHHQLHDPEGKYPVDCRINGMSRPVLVQALPNDDKTRDATITFLQYEKWGVPFRSLAIFEDQEEISRKVLARFSDICEKQFSSLGANKDRIKRFIQESMA